MSKPVCPGVATNAREQRPHSLFRSFQNLGKVSLGERRGAADACHSVGGKGEGGVWVGLLEKSFLIITL